MSGFDRLHPSLQHHVVNSLEWTELRPLQEQAIDPILAGEHIIALAPTAGGKTEAAMLPLLSRIVAHGWRGLSVLYVCPLRALLNNLHPRLERYAGFVGLRAGLWHGDIGAAARGRIFDEPPEILLTTPESLEAILLSSRRDHEAFFANLHSVVVDEVHAFGGDDRGWHLLVVLERISVVAGRDLQRIGLSATVGKPQQLLRWLVGSSQAPARVVAPTEGVRVVAPEVTLDHVGSLSNAATVISRLHAGERRLVFCDSRAGVEELAVGLRQRGVNTFVSHSSLALDERRRAEEAFAGTRDCVIVSTSTLELGIDVGDLDRVIQIDSPTTVASFLQRLGRTGRRQGSVRNALFLTTKPDIELVRAAGLLSLWASGYVEPVVGPPIPYHLIAQQLLAQVLQEGSVARSRWSEVLGRLPVFADAIAAGIGDEILHHLLRSKMLFDDGGILSMGPGAEQAYGRRHFLELTSAFTSTPLFVIRYGTKEIGYLDPIALLTPDRSFASVLLGGRTWRVTSIDWERRFAWVEPGELGGRSRWLGDSQPLSASLCDAVRKILAGENPSGVTLTTRASNSLEEIRSSFWWVRPGRTAVIADERGLTWWTFAGLHANAGIMAGMGSLLAGSKVDNLTIRLSSDGATAERVRDFVEFVDPDELSRPSIAEDLASKLKFADCLPEHIALDVAGARVRDPAGIGRALREPVDQVANQI